MNAFYNRAGKPIIMAMIKEIQDNKDYLSRIDGLIGDGDHGANMNKGFTLCKQHIAQQDISFTEGLNELGSTLLTEIGGSMGPIYGTLFMSMAEAAEDAEQIDAIVFLNMLNCGLDGLWEIVQAQVGDKTLIDTLVPARDAFALAVEADESFESALDKLKASAVKGMEDTCDMIAKFGRASRLGERSRGIQDAGATSCNIVLQSIADEIKQQLTIED